MGIRFLEWRTYKIDDCMALGVIVDIAVVIIVVGGGVWDATGVAARWLRGGGGADAEQLGVKPALRSAMPEYKCRVGV